MDRTFQKFLRSGLDLAPLGVERREENLPYFCTPKGAAIFGWAGVDGIHYCFIRGFGGMVFAVSPMNAAPDCVHPLARDFADFLRLLLACGDAARRLPGQKGTVDVYVKDQPLRHPAPSFGFRYVRSSWFRKQYNTNCGNMRTKFRKFYRVR